MTQCGAIKDYGFYRYRCRLLKGHKFSHCDVNLDVTWPSEAEENEVSKLRADKARLENLLADTISSENMLRADNERLRAVCELTTDLMDALYGANAGEESPYRKLPPDAQEAANLVMHSVFAALRGEESPAND